jgi:glycosyltransferase involved in cell wall biosynthesis
MISILMPIYNGEKFLESSIDSIINQTFTKFELLIGFNGTVDRSKEIVSKYNDSRIRVFDYGDDNGKSKTLNKLLNEVKYDLVCIQDDDDIWVPNKLEKQIPYFKNFDVVGTLISYINEEGDITGKPDLSIDPHQIHYLSMIGINQVANTSAIFKRQDALDINGWVDGLDGIEDYDFWLRLMRNGKKFINVPEELVLHRLHANSNFNTKKYDLSKIL